MTGHLEVNVELGLKVREGLSSNDRPDPKEVKDVCFLVARFNGITDDHCMNTREYSLFRHRRHSPRFRLLFTSLYFSRDDGHAILNLIAWMQQHLIAFAQP